MNFSNILRDTFKLYQSTFGLHLLGSLILFAVVFIVYASLITTIFGMPLENIVALQDDPEKLIVLASSRSFVIKFWFFSLLIDGIITPLTAGFYRNYVAVIRGERTTLGNLFAYYHAPETSAILSHVILQMCLKTLLLVGFSTIGMNSLGLAFTTIISLVFVLTIPIIIFESKPLFKAMGESYRRIMLAPFTALIVTFLGCVFVFAGLFSFGIGIVITFPLLFAGIFSIYLSTGRR
ncbi:hypothetical protein RCZ04_22370 [Capnocytophaga sp. HP1101]